LAETLVAERTQGTSGPEVEERLWERQRGREVGEGLAGVEVALIILSLEGLIARKIQDAQFNVNFKNSK
jgi:hypothetical protein